MEPGDYYPSGVETNLGGRVETLRGGTSPKGFSQHDTGVGVLCHEVVLSLASVPGGLLTEKANRGDLGVGVRASFTHHSVSLKSSLFVVVNVGDSAVAFGARPLKPSLPSSRQLA